MKSYSQLAQIAYALYCKRAGVVPNGPQTLPAWAALSPLNQACWIEAVKGLVAEYQSLH